MYPFLCYWTHFTRHSFLGISLQTGTTRRPCTSPPTGPHASPCPHFGPHVIFYSAPTCSFAFIELLFGLSRSKTGVASHQQVYQRPSTRRHFMLCVSFFLSLAWLDTPVAAQVQFVPYCFILPCLLVKMTHFESFIRKVNVACVMNPQVKLKTEGGIVYCFGCTYVAAGIQEVVQPWCSWHPRSVATS